MDEVCNISNKNQPPSNLIKYQYFKGAKDFKNHFMNISIYIALVPLWRHSNKEKIHKDLKNGIMRALEITNQNNPWTAAFPPLGNRVIGFSTDWYMTIMLKTMRHFINKNSNSSPKIIRVVVNNIQHVKFCTRIMMGNNLGDSLCR